MKKSLMLIFLSIPIIGGCLTESPVVLKSVTNQSTSTTVSPTTEPTFVPTPTPIPTPTPKFSFTGDRLNSYSKNLACLPVDESFKTKLDFPVDLAVTKDGKKVYVMNLRKGLSTFLYIAPKSKDTIDRQFIYEIKEDKSISAVKINGEYPFSCQLSEEVEIDKDDNLYISKPIIDFDIVSNQFVGHEIYKITPDKQMSLYTKIDLGLPDPSPSDTPDPRILSNLHFNDKNDLFYLLRTQDSEYTDKLSRLDTNKKITDILSYSRKYNGDIRDFAIYNDQIYTGLYKFDIKDGGYSDGSLADFILNNSSVQQIYNKGKPLVYGDTIPIKKSGRIALDSVGNVYISDNESNVIWKIIQDKEIIKFAGSGKAGYKDGQGENAQFNNPTTMTFDSQGNMFVADSGNNAIRKITPDGTVSTFYKESN